MKGFHVYEHEMAFTSADMACGIFVEMIDEEWLYLYGIRWRNEGLCIDDRTCLFITKDEVESIL